MLSRQRPLLLAFAIAAVLASLALLPQAASAQVMNSVQFWILTGGDDLRGDSDAKATIAFANGASNTFTLKNQGDPSWDNNTLHSPGPFALGPVDYFAITSISITLTSHNSGFEGDDNWNINQVVINVQGPGGGPYCIVNLSGNPLSRLTGTQPTLTMSRGQGCPG